MTTPASAPLTVSPERDLLDHAGIIFAVVPGMLLFGITSTFIDLPRILIVSELASDRYRIQWPVGAALLGSALGMSSIAWLIARLGLRTCYQIALLIYLTGSAGVALTPGVDVLMAARFIQSWGIGMVISTALILLWREFPRHRDLGVVVFAFGIYFGRILGPVISSWLVNHDSWRTPFYLTTAIAAITLLFSWWALQPDAPPQASREPFDSPGLVLLAGWVVCMVIGLYRFQLWGWHRANETLIVFAVGLAVFTIFVWHQFTKQYPLLHLRLLFTRHHFGMSVVIKAMFDGVFFAVLAILTRYLVITRDYPRPTAGAVFLPAVAAMAVTLAITAHFGSRGNRKFRLALGLVAMSLACWQFTRIDLFTEKEWVSAILAVWACGVGLAAAPIICVSQDNLEQSVMVRTLSIKNLGLILPGMIGASFVEITTERAGDAYFDVLRQTIQPNRMPVEDVSVHLADWIASTHGSDPAIALTQASQVLGRYVRDTASVFAFQTAFGWLSVVGTMAAVLALTLRKLPPDAPGPQRG